MIEINKKKIADDIIECSSLISKAMGLRFKKIRQNQAYLFSFNSPTRALMDMWFVFYPIDVIFLDENNKVIELKEKFLPFSSYLPKNRSKIIIELDDGTIKSNGINLGDIVKFK